MGRMKRRRGDPDADGLSPNAKREKEDFFWKRGEAKCAELPSPSPPLSLSWQREEMERRERER